MYGSFYEDISCGPATNCCRDEEEQTFSKMLFVDERIDREKKVAEWDATSLFIDVHHSRETDSCTWSLLI